VSHRDELEKRLEQAERRIRELEYCQRIADDHIAAIENSIIFRFLRRVGRPFLDLKARVARWLGESRLHTWNSRFFPAKPDEYASWVSRESAQAPPSLKTSPTFSILVHVSQPRREWLDEAIASVRVQSYAAWELHISYESGTEPWLEDYLERLVASDTRIHTIRAPREAGVSTALNLAAGLASGDYRLVLGACDRFDPNALNWIAALDPAEIIYADEDVVDDHGRGIEPIFKPDWSPDLLLSCMYFGRMMAISRQAWERAGGYRPAYEHAQDYDLALRITDHPVSVEHVARVLYHRRLCEDPAARSSSAAARRAIDDTLRRRGVLGQVADGQRPCVFQVLWKTSDPALASLIICSRSPRLLNQCLQSVADLTRYTDRETIVIQHQGADDSAMQQVMERFGAKCVPYSGAFHFARMNNLGAQAARGSVLVFLNDDTEVIEESWLERLVGQVERPDIGVAGARLLYPSGTLQHAGIVVGIGDGCGHIGRGELRAPYWPWLELTRDVAAVTGACLAVRKKLFCELRGFSDDFPSNYNDVDLCLRVREAGYRVICDAAVALKHYEGKTRQCTVTSDERRNWYNRWSKVIEAGDPFYSPNLTRDREDLSLRR